MSAKSKKPSPSPTRIVVVGKSGAGKTCMIHVLQKDEFPTDYVRNVLGPTRVTLKIEEVEHEIIVVDTPGEPEFVENRLEVYPDTNLFLVCYSIVDPSEYYDLEKWVTEIRDVVPDARFIIVGLKSDLRSDESTLQILRTDRRRPVTPAQGASKAKVYGALMYRECSAVQKVGVRAVFEEALGACHPPPQGGCCNVC